MPPVRACLFTAALLAAIVTATPPRAEMTEADKEGMRAFAECLDEAGNDESDCIEKLGRFAWFPRDEKTCEAVSTRVNGILAVDGDPIWRDMFQNERCARVGMIYSTLALPDKSPNKLKLRPVDCRKEIYKGRCYETDGRHEWNPVGDNSACEFYASVPISYPDSIQTEWWNYWFNNERCRRIGMPYFDAAAGVAREATVEPKQ